MKKLCTVAALAALLVLSAAVQAGGGCGCGCAEACWPPKPSPPRTFLEIKFRPIELEITEDKLVPHEIVTYVKCVESVPVWKECQRQVTTYTKVAREIEKEVVSCKMVPECVCDPCTGCMKTCYKPQVCVQKVKSCVWDCVPVTQTITEKVCTMEKREKMVEKRCIVNELIEETRREAVTLVTLERYAGHLPSPPAPCCNK